MSQAVLENIEVPSPAPAERVTIRARSGWQPINFRELWHYRELIWFLALRDVKVRYKQTALGAAWAILQPLMNTLIFYIFLGKLGGLASPDKTGGVPYVLLTFCAQLPWQFFSNALSQAGMSLVANERLVSKVYFPRLSIPIASVMGGLVDTLFSFVMLVALMAWYHVVPGWQIVFLPFFMMLALITALAAGLWLSALNVEYRDIRFVIPFLTQIWMFASPVVYTSFLVRSNYPKLYPFYCLNPMVAVIRGCRWALLQAHEPPGLPESVGAVAAVLLLLGGLYYFRRMERTFADLV